MKDEYNMIRDNLAIGIATMADIYDKTQNEPNPKFEAVFEYTINQLNHFDILWDKIRGYH